MKLKHPSNSTSKTLSAMTSSQDARVLVRETLRISANLASAPRPALPPPPISAAADGNVATFGLVEEQFLNSSLRLICREEIDGRRWEYFADLDNSKQFRKKSIRAVSLHSRQAPGQVSFCLSQCTIPQIKFLFCFSLANWVFINRNLSLQNCTINFWQIQRGDQTSTLICLTSVVAMVSFILFFIFLPNM